jgi:hypothetical protein
VNVTLIRKEFRKEGIFGILVDETGVLIAHTLEHAYEDGKGGWAPKIPEGDFTCERSMHRLHGMTHDFETFEITGVVGHDNLLFHWGNFNKDSEGCILLGEREQGGMVTNSRKTFSEFMEMQSGLDQFQLTVMRE